MCSECIYLHMLLLLLLSHFSCVWLCATPKTAARQAPLSLGFSRQEHWSGLPCRVPLFATPCTVAYQVPPSMGFSRQEGWSGLSLHIDIHKHTLIVWLKQHYIQWKNKRNSYSVNGAETVIICENNINLDPFLMSYIKTYIMNSVEIP